MTGQNTFWQLTDMDVWNMFACIHVYAYVLNLCACVCVDAMSVQTFACMSRFASYVLLAETWGRRYTDTFWQKSLPIEPKTGGTFHSPPQPTRFSPSSTYLVQRSRNSHFVVSWLDFDGIAHIFEQSIGHATESERSSKGTTDRSCNRIRAKQGLHVWHIKSGYKHLHAVSAVSLVKFELMLLQSFSSFCLHAFLPWFTFLFPWQYLAAVYTHRSHCGALCCPRWSTMRNTTVSYFYFQKQRVSHTLRRTNN